MAKKSKAKAPVEKKVVCPDCSTPLTFVNERRGPMVAKTEERNHAWHGVESYNWWAVCEKCGQAWHHDDHAPSMYVLRDEIEGRVRA